MRAWCCVSALLACAAAVGCAGDPESQVVDATAAEHGKALFDDPGVAATGFNAYACSTCHEAVAGDAGDLILSGAPLAGAVARPSYWGGSELDLLRAINACLYFFMLKEKPWQADDEAAQAIYAYLESLPGGGAASEAAPFTPVYDVVTPPPGDAGRGAGLYRRACASCHGGAHSGEGRLVERAPVLPEQTLGEHPSPDYTDADRRLVFVEKVRHGGFVGYGGQMPPFSSESLSEQDLGDILQFLGVP